tara:strand:- start:2196 stop:3218 length:1023 start_codon:yes stop_codon:yes gene_type:complete
MSFKRLEADDFVVSSDSITSTLWSTGVQTLTTFFTSSVQKAGSSGDFYLSVFEADTLINNQFDIAYANSTGLGGARYTSTVTGKTPTLSTYGQYRSLILEDETKSFTFGTGDNVHTATDFWVISIERARYKESLFPGSLNLALSGSNVDGTGATIHLTDNSKDVSVNTFLGSSRVYQLISGSSGTAGSLANSGHVANSGSYGLVFPELGTILLNPQAISQSINIDATRTANSTNGVSAITLFESINKGLSFQLNSQETISSDYVFARARNSEFNYTQNPTFISGSTGEVIYDNFINNPQTYITTVGMYNDTNDLLAVAKLSRPLLKDFTKEALVRVKLDF